MTPKGPTLTDPKGMGGIVAQAGFDYQIWDALIRLPAWLRTPAFEGFAVEVLQDVEARFFAPLAPYSYFVDRYQAKFGSLNPGEVTEVFKSFREFDLAHPGVARVHVLVTPALPRTLHWIARDISRVQQARPFYRPFPEVVAASDAKLRADLIAECGREIGEFVAVSVDVALRNCPDRATAEASFSLALHDAFPEAEVPTSKMREAFAAVRDLAEARRGAMLSRNSVLDLLERILGVPLITDKRLRVNVRSDISADVPDALEIDATKFSGATGNYPAATCWRTDLVIPLENTARWARNQGYSRVELTGSYRLSTALALGWSFRSAVGFELDIPTKSGAWATDSHPTTGEAPPWQVSIPKTLLGDRLVVAIGVIRNPAPDVVRSLTAAGDDQLLLATLPNALTSAVEAQASARVVKTAVADAVGRLRPTAIDLFYVGPSAFAVALGHRWNGLPPTQLWEFLRQDGTYVPTALLG